ncbi:MAG: HAMP domain-containing protein [Spirochaetales bacterium]|nr:HAMP domain-containing protein [Spirochaetales bacterium]
MTIRRKINLTTYSVLIAFFLIIGATWLANRYVYILDNAISVNSKLLNDWNRLNSISKDILMSSRDMASLRNQWVEELAEFRQSMKIFQESPVFDMLKMGDDKNLTGLKQIWVVGESQFEEIEELFTDYVETYGERATGSGNLSFQLGKSFAMREFDEQYSEKKILAEKLTALTMQGEGLLIFIDKITRVVEENAKRLKSLISFGTIILFAFVTIGMFLVVRGVMNSMSCRIIKLEKVMSQAAEKDFTISIEDKAKDEIGQLSAHLNNVIDTFRKVLGDTKNQAEKSASLKGVLSDRLGPAVVSIKAIRDKVEEITRNFQTLDGTIDKSAEAVRGINQSIDILSSNISDQASAMNETSASIEEMEASIRRVAVISEERGKQADLLQEVTRDGGEKVEGTFHAIREINAEINQMHTIIEVIQEVATQTDILSMNAAIESAHAGDAGKGFAVVAEEIRKLAETTAEKSKEIAGSLRSMVEKIAAALENSEESSRAFEMVEKEVDKFSGAITEISHTMKELSLGSNEILNAVSQVTSISQITKENSVVMREGVESIMKSMEEVNTFSSQVLKEMSSIQKQTESVTVDMDAVKELNRKSSEELVILAEHLSTFKT